MRKARCLAIASVLASSACTGAPARPGLGPPAGDTPSGSADELDAGDAAGPNPCDDAGDRGDGATFTDLYRDFFGPMGLATCSARSICHVPGGQGAQLSGYECYPDQVGCWTSMTSAGLTTSIVPDGGTPEDTLLYRILRKAPPTPGSGPMPRNSSFAFCPNDLARITAWIDAGAPNN
jgi:hypothetical protein